MVTKYDLMVWNSRVLSSNLCSYLDGVEFIDARPEVVGVSPERDLQQRQEPVHAGQQTLRTEEGIRSSSPQTKGQFFPLLCEPLCGSYVLADVLLEGMPSNTMTLSAR